MTQLEEKQLIKLAQNKNNVACHEAIGKLIQANTGLVKSIANKFTKYDVDFEELFTLGLEGLVTAIRKFKPKAKNKLCTFAYLEIVQAIQKGISERAMVYIPEGQLKLYWTIQSFKQDYYNTNRCYPSVSTIAKELKITKKQVIKNSKVINQVYSLDKTIDPNEKQTSASTVADERLNPHQLLVQEEALDQLYDCLRRSLSDKQYQVIVWSYGLDSSVGKLEAKQIAKKLNLSVPAVRKIQYGTLDLLRNLTEMKLINANFE